MRSAPLVLTAVVAIGLAACGGDDDDEASTNTVSTDPASTDAASTAPPDTGDDSALPPDILDMDGDSDLTEAVSLDLLANPRVVGGAVDMGAYEVQ